jgi:hypothetical protein
MKFWESDGSCPFLMCTETAPHRHPICDECRAVRFGNLCCSTCRRERGKWNASISELLETNVIEQVCQHCHKVFKGVYLEHLRDCPGISIHPREKR